MATIIAIANQKGGVGKTTTSVNLAAALVQQGRRVLLVDADPQGNATMGCGIDKHAATLSLKNVLLSEHTLPETVVTAEPLALDVLVGNAELVAAEVQLLAMPQREFQLKKALETVRDRYDYIVLDCPPSLNMLTINALVAADGLLVPMQCEYYALEGLSALLETMTHVQKTANPGLKIEGIVRTLYDGRNRLSTDVSMQLLQHFPEQLYRTVIPRNIRLAEAPSFGLPIMLYDKRSQGTAAYIALAAELIRRVELGERVRADEPELEEEEIYGD